MHIEDDQAPEPTNSGVSLGTSVIGGWMWPSGIELKRGGSVADLVNFRSLCEVDQFSSEPVVLRVSAQSRYRLTINQQLVAVGPAKPSTGRCFVDTTDISPFLRVGVNVVAIEVLTYTGSRNGNASVLRTGAPGLLVSGLIGDLDLSDPSVWRCQPVEGRSFLQGQNTVFLGIQEFVDGTLLTPGWMAADFDDSAWVTPSFAGRDDAIDGINRPRIHERTIPAMTLDPIQFLGVSNTISGSLDDAALIKGNPVWVGAKQVVELDLDAGELTTAYLELLLIGGAEATVEFTAAECYEDVPIEIPWRRRKGNRTDAVNGDIYGDPDTYRVAGIGSVSAPERFAPFWFRTFRYLRLRITTLGAELALAIRVTRTRYPLPIAGTFASSSELDGRLWETSVRTLLNCMHETFEDCPFYEQIQYVMDTRSQALFALHLSTDDRLVRRAIEDFAASGDQNGLTESRTPCVQTQFIPGFSLFWIFMVLDHLKHVGDRAFTAQYIGRIDAVLGFFDQRLTEDGFVLSPPETEDMWSFVDWTELWNHTRGVPNLGDRRANTIMTFMYVCALESAATIARHCGRPGLAAEYQRRAFDLRKCLANGPSWDENRAYFRDSDDGEPASQHAQIWAVLAGAVTGSAASDLLRRAVADETLAPCSYAMAFYQFEALRVAGLDDLIDWTPWSNMLDAGLTTWAEDEIGNRSDCHAWGSVPLQQFPQHVLGVRPTAPGFAAVAIDPAPSDLTFAQGVVPTPHGRIQLFWQRAHDGRRSVTVTLPAVMRYALNPMAGFVRDSVDGDTRTVTFQQ